MRLAAPGGMGHAALHLYFQQGDKPQVKGGLKIRPYEINNLDQLKFVLFFAEKWRTLRAPLWFYSLGAMANMAMAVSCITVLLPITVCCSSISCAAI